MRKFFVSKNKRTLAEFRRELARAHLLIALMSVVTILLVSLGTARLSTLDTRLTTLCVVLLTVVSLISLYVSVALFRKKD